MARPASPLTQAIREILDKTGGQANYEAIREQLAQKGFKLPPPPGPKSELLKQLEQYSFNTDAVNAALLGKDVQGNELTPEQAKQEITDLLGQVFDHMELNQNQIDTLIKEMRHRLEYQRAYRNVEAVRHNWKKAAGTVSKRRGRPAKASAKVQKTGKRRGRPPKAASAKVQKTTKRRGRPAKTMPTLVWQPTPEQAAALQLIEQEGGVEGARQKIEALREALKVIKTVARDASRFAKQLENQVA